MEIQNSFNDSKKRGKLYLVPTPIGNLGDITFRALEILNSSDFILSEDTRYTSNLLNKFDIKTRQISFHDHNSQDRIPKILKLIKEGSIIAQVSDAGIPSISDPGYDLVRESVKNNISVIPLPGANAGITALIASGLIPQPFLFYGFLPRKNHAQQLELSNFITFYHTIIFYESPHHLEKTLNNFKKILGGDRKIVLAREITKKYEEFIRGSISEILEWIKDRKIRGEFVILLDGNHNRVGTSDLIDMSVKEHVLKIIEMDQLKVNDAIKKVAKIRKINKRDVYNEFHGL